MASLDVMKTGESVMLIGGSITRLVQLKPRDQVKLGRIRDVDLGSLIGQQCGIIYEIDEARRVLVPYIGPTLQDAAEVQAELVEGEDCKDNRNLRDLSDSQAMTQEEIERIKAEEGVKGLVDRLVHSSATFDEKTSFAQQKYIRRKKRKYVVTYLVERVTVDNLAEIWCPTRTPDHIPEVDSRWLRLRVDAYAQLFSLANVHASSRVMVSEHTNGVLPSAILTKLGNEGLIYHILEDKCHATMTHAKTFGLDNVKARWKCIRLQALLDPNTPQHPSEQQQKPRVSAADSETALVGQSAVESQWYNGEEANALFATAPVDSLVVAKDVSDLAAHVLSLLPFVAPSGTVTVYSPFFELAADVARALRNDCVCVSLRDTWYREYQILPGRTHPFVNMTHNSGYIVSATRVEKEGV